jgi:hypothetical protein
MPYIAQNRRDDMDMGELTPQTPGDLNFAVTKVINDYLQERTLYKDEYSYVDLNDILGALEGAKMEFYRRVVVPYEEKKREKYGDVYGTAS